MLKVRVDRSGPEIGVIVGNLTKRLRQRLHGALLVSVTEWRRLVVSSTWFNSRPSPGNFIIAKWRAVGANAYVLEYGWTNYTGDQGRAEWRMGLRAWMYEPRVMERIERIVTETLSGKGGV